MDQPTANISKYLRLFSFYYAAALIVISLIGFFFAADTNIAVSLITLYVTAQFVSIKFVKAEHHIPEKAEKRLLVWGSLLLSFFISIIITLGELWYIYAKDSLDRLTELLALPMDYWVVFGLVAALVYWCILTLAYGWGAKKYAQRQNIAGDTFD